MSYEPTNWQAGDTVTSAKLNKIEQGIANGGIRIVHIIEIEPSGEVIQETSGGEGEVAQNDTSPTMRLDITPNDLEDMLNNGQLPLLLQENVSNGYEIYMPFSGYGKQTNPTQYICGFGDSMNDSWLSTNLDEYFNNIDLPK